MDDEELFIRAMPPPEAMRRYMGKWIGIDDAGEIRFFGTTAGDVLKAVQSEGLPFDAVSLLFVPKHSFVG